MLVGVGGVGHMCVMLLFRDSAKGVVLVYHMCAMVATIIARVHA